MNLRLAVSALLLFYVAFAYAASSKPYVGAEHRYGYPWEHSLAEWAQITARVNSEHQMRRVYGFVPVHSGHEEQRWVWVRAD